MKNNYRQFSIYDLEIGARKDGATLPDMYTVATVWQRMAGTGKTYEVHAGDSIMILGDIELDTSRNVIVMLVRISSKSSPNSVYSDLHLGTYDEHLKIGDQGSDFGCHVFVSLSQEKNRPNIYTCAIEKVSGLPADLIRRLLSKFLHCEYKESTDFFSYPNPAGGCDRKGNPRIERCCPHVELRARPSEALIDDLNNGYLTGVTLIKTEAVQPIGGASYLLKEKSELKLGVDHNSLPANLWDGIKSALKRNSPNYQKARIFWKLKDSSKNVSIEVDSATSTILSDGYIKYFEINNIFPFLAQSAPKIVPHLRDLALPQFVLHRES